MRIQNIIRTLAFALLVTVSACGGKSSVLLDSTDGITLDGTFREAIEGFEQADQLKAAAGLLIFSYEGASEDNRPTDYILRSKEQASILLDGTNGGNVFEQRGAVLNQIATESGGILNGKSAQDLIDKYNIATEQYDEYLKDQKEAAAAEEARQAAEAEAARLQAVVARRGELEMMLASLGGAVSANQSKREALSTARDAAAYELAALRERLSGMATDVTPTARLARAASNINGGVTVIIVNRTGEPIMNPVVEVLAIPNSQPARSVLSRAAGLYKGEEKGQLIGVEASSAPLTFPVRFRLGANHPASEGARKDFSNMNFEAYLVGYERADGSDVSLTLDPAKQTLIDGYAGAVGRCDVADEAIEQARAAIPAALEALSLPDADPSAVADIAELRC